MSEELEAHLSTAVQETVPALVGLELTQGPAPPWPPAEVELLMGVGLMGARRSDLYLGTDWPSARRLAQGMVGSEAEEVVPDVLRELLNVLAGAFKHAVDPAGGRLDLGVPYRIEAPGDLRTPPEAGVTALTFEAPGISLAVSLVEEAEGPSVSTWG